MTVPKRLLRLALALDHDHRVSLLPIGKRLLHRQTIRHVVVILCGASICLLGSWMAKHVDIQDFLPHCVWDALAYLIHGFGSIPILAHGEKLLSILE